jgi:hypothetical protein
MADEQSVNGTPRRNHVNCSGLSRQQRDLLDAIAQAQPDHDGAYEHHWVFLPANRSESASVSRAVAGLERRGIIERGHRHRFFLTRGGCALVNEVREWFGLPRLEFTPRKPPLSDEEFARRCQEIGETCAMVGAKEAAEHLSPAGLEELRNWIDQRLTAFPRGNEVNG